MCATADDEQCALSVVDARTLPQHASRGCVALQTRVAPVLSVLARVLDVPLGMRNCDPSSLPLLHCVYTSSVATRAVAAAVLRHVRRAAGRSTASRAPADHRACLTTTLTRASV